MRYGMKNLSSGAGALAQALLGGTGTEDKAYRDEMGTLGAHRLRMAQAHKAGEEARTTRIETDQRTDALDRLPAIRAGLNEPESEIVKAFMSTGSWGAEGMGPPTADGRTDPPGFLTPGGDEMARYDQGRLAAAMMAAAPGSNVSQLAAALQGASDLSLQDGIMRGDMDPTLGAQSRFATSGAAPFKAGGEGTVLNQVSGALDESGMGAQGHRAATQALAGQRNASAANSYASAARTQHDMNAPPAPTPLLKHMAAAGIDPQSEEGRALLIQSMQPKGMRLTTGPNGELSFATGVPAGNDFGNSANTQLDKDILGSTSTIQRLTQIEQSFKPEFLETATRLQAGVAGFKDRAGLASPEEQQSLREFAMFKQSAASNLSAVIKDFAGAAVSDQELQRMLAMLPNAGTGVFDGDSPTEFKAKLDAVSSMARMVTARLSYVRQNGLTINDLSIESMPQVIDQRILIIEDEILQQQPNMPPEQLREMVKQRIADEFGLIAGGQ